MNADSALVLSMLHLVVWLHLSGPEYEEVEVHLLREKTGFGFRILGGDEAVQAVSPDARDKARMGRAGPLASLTSCTPADLTSHASSKLNAPSSRHTSPHPRAAQSRPY